VQSNAHRAAECGLRWLDVPLVQLVQQIYICRSLGGCGKDNTYEEFVEMSECADTIPCLGTNYLTPLFMCHNYVHWMKLQVYANVTRPLW